MKKRLASPKKRDILWLLFYCFSIPILISILSLTIWETSWVTIAVVWIPPTIAFMVIISRSFNSFADLDDQLKIYRWQGEIDFDRATMEKNLVTISSSKFKCRTNGLAYGQYLQGFFRSDDRPEIVFVCISDFSKELYRISDKYRVAYLQVNGD